jgi:phenylpyruvate tautomerase PptA (4-oxalocrotonate tautomerase family)
MPIVQVDIPEGQSAATKDRLREGLKHAIDTVFDPAQRGRYPETRQWIYVSVRESYGHVGDGLPTVTVDTRPGRKPEQKLELARRICDVFESALGTRKVYVLLRETPAADHIGGGESLPEWRQQ